MWIVRAALRFRWTVAVMVAVIVASAVLGARRMRADVLPVVDVPVVVVVWAYTGLSAEDMERRVVLVSERAYSSSVDGVARIESRSLSGVGVIKLYFNAGANVGAAIAQVASMSSTVTRLMPAGIMPPAILQWSASNVPIAEVTVSSETKTEQELFDYGLNSLRVRLFTIPGLSLPLPYGGKTRQVMIDVDPAALAARGLSAEDVVRAVGDANLTVPAGALRVADIEYDVALNNSPTTVAEFDKIPLRFGGGAPVRLGDVARVRDGFAVQQNIVRVDGKRATYLTLLKKGDASTLAVIEGARALLPQIKAAAPQGIDLSIDADQSVFVRGAVASAIREGAVAAALVSLFMILALGSFRSAILVATSIPLSIGAAVAGLALTGQTLNLMTIGGLALATGMLVDDATVEVENIHRNRALGKALHTSILDGAREVALPALAATLSVCIVFVPVLFLEGPVKSLFAPLALAVVFAMLASYVLSRTLVPALASVLLSSAPASHANPSRLARALSEGYARVLDASLARPWAVGAAAVLAIVAAAMMAPALGLDFFPEVDAGQMRLHVRAPVGTRIERTEEIVSAVEKVIREVVPASDLARIRDDLGVPTPLNLAFVQTDNVGSQDAEVSIALAPGHRPTAPYRAVLRARLAAAFPECQFYFQPADIVARTLGFGSAAPIDVVVVGGDPEVQVEVALRLRDRLRGIPGIVDVHLPEIADHPALSVAVDRERAAELGLTQRDVADSVLTQLSSSSVTSPSFWLDPRTGVNYTVAVQAPLHALATTRDLMATPLTGSRVAPARDTSTSRTMPPATLGGVATMSAGQSKALLSHETIQRAVHVAASIEGRDLGGVARDVDRVLAMERDLPKGMRVVVRGLGPDMFAAFHDLGVGVALAVIAVFLLLVVLFQSWREPLAVMAAVPGALAGVGAALFVTRTTLNVESFMGAILTVGVVVANSTLLVHFARAIQLETGHAGRSAIALAARTRLRPVMMTMLAMMGGMVPLAFGHGEGAEQNAPLARAVIGGLLAATAATLFVVPVVFAALRRRVPQARVAEDAAPGVSAAWAP